jgi:hypothetical protein
VPWPAHIYIYAYVTRTRMALLCIGLASSISPSGSEPTSAGAASSRFASKVRTLGVAKLAAACGAFNFVNLDDAAPAVSRLAGARACVGAQIVDGDS